MNGKLLGFVSILALSLGGVWLWTQKNFTSERSREVASAGPTAEVSAEEQSEPEKLELKTSVPEEVDRKIELSNSEVTERSVVVAAETNFSEDDAVWMNVSVLIPPGLPLEDQPALLALSVIEESPGGKDWLKDLADHGVLDRGVQEMLEHRHVLWARRSLDATTNVRVPFHRDAKLGFLLIRSDYLILAPVEVDIQEHISEDQLEPELGGVLAGRITFPPQAQERDIHVDEVELNLMGRPTDSGFGGFRGMDLREVDVGEDGTFLVPRLSTSHTYMATAEGEGFAKWFKRSVKVGPGEYKEFEIAVELGGTITGTVTDQAGKPLPGISVSAQGGGGMWFGRDEVSAETDAGGRYEISCVPPGTNRVQVSADSWAEPEPRAIEIEEKEVISGIDFALARGKSISGRVMWPDGIPAQGSKVTASVVRTGGWHETKSTSTAGEDGRFVLYGLESGVFEVRVRPDLTEEVAGQLGLEWSPSDHRKTPSARALEPSVEAFEEISEISTRPPSEGKQRWMARMGGVEVGTVNLELLLEPPLTIMGRVVDGSGAPVTSFKAHAKPSGAVRWSPDAIREDVYESKDGTFQLAVAYKGTWSLSVESPEYIAEEEATEIEVPSSAEFLLVMNKAGLLAGLVTDPFGQPIEGAEITATGGSSQGNPFMFGRTSVEGESDEDGRFEVRAESDRMTLVAKHEDWAASEALALELAPSESRNDLVLQLRMGARITGEVFDAEGEPIAGQNVTAGKATNGPFPGGEHSVRADAAGRFFFEHVEPGKIVVTAMPSQEEILEKVSENQDPAAMLSVFSGMVSETVEVVDGGEAHVTLGQKAKDPVRVYGRVTEAGSPVDEAMVMVLNDGEGSMMEGMKATRTDANGNYETDVDRPGSYVVTVQAEGLESSGIQFFLDVPDAEEIEHNLELPMGRIEGRVFGSDGKPVSGVMVSALREGGVMDIEEFGQSTGRMTEEAGSFSFEHLRTATYSVTAGNASNFFSGGTARFASQMVTGIVVEQDRTASGIEIHLEAPGTLEGTVVDRSGMPVSGAAVHVRNEAGRALARISQVITNPAGKFTYEGLPSGSLTVTARTADACSTESRRVQILTSETTEVEIVVEPGAYLIVQLLDEGEPVRARLRVLDEEGREVNGLLSMALMQELFTEGMSSRERRVGPVPPGKYKLEATTMDGKTAKKTVRLKSGENKRRVKLRLKD
ncbi:MAG: hypothetical protein CMJ89_01960 [Planctomycetes bacterium]|nr:hypothetical protein [Planctomycetota bacterium]